MMKSVPIARIAASDHSVQAEYLSAGAPYPCILDGATSEWPARSTWTLAHFSERFGETLGRAGLQFGVNRGGRAVKLREFIAHSDKPLADVPGFWVDRRGLPLDCAPEYDEGQVWSFMWQPFREHQELFDEIAPFPAQFENQFTSAAAPGYLLLEELTGIDFHSLYITRAGTITPLHRDHDHTFGCLVQFDGRKTVAMLQPDLLLEGHIVAFDPEAPDFASFPALQSATAHVAVLEPGDMLIIPPDWWHYTRALTPSLTLSHNFFNPGNAARYLSSALDQVDDPSARTLVRQTFSRFLGQASA
jgi:Cupin-like domain